MNHQLINTSPISILLFIDRFCSKTYSHDRASFEDPFAKGKSTSLASIVLTLVIIGSLFLDKFLQGDLANCIFHPTYGFDTDHPTKVRAQSLGSKSTYRNLTRSPTNRVLTSEAGIKLAFLWNTNPSTFISIIFYLS